MSIKDRFKTDSATATSGAWFTYEPNSDGSIPRFKLARASGKQNKKYQAACRKLLSENNDDLEAMEDKAGEAALLKIFLDTILLDWENFQPEDNGVSLPFSPEAAEKIFSSPDWFDFYSDLNMKSQRAAGFRARSLSAEAKN